jgi:hypothetical protein
MVGFFRCASPANVGLSQTSRRWLGGRTTEKLCVFCLHERGAAQKLASDGRTPSYQGGQGPEDVSMAGERKGFRSCGY